MTLSGFESDEAARTFAGKLQAYLHVIGQYLDLERLDAVSVAYNYPEALANVDRGLGGTATLTATSASYGLGVAMTPAVLRNGVVKAHMVYDANVVRGIEADEINRELFHLIAHECGHVHDLKARDEAFPNVLMQTRYSNLRRNVLGSTAAACWDEYAASYFSAQFSIDETADNLAELFIGAARDAREHANESIKRYRRHGDIRLVVSEVGAEYGNTLKFAAYLLGQLHGLGMRLADHKAANDFVAGHWCAEFVNRLDVALTTLMARYGEWSDITEFSILETIADDLLKDGGVTVTEISDEEVYAQIPFTAETMPG
ncbi:hypothetical protein UNPF46_25240 [Bradyrhizobium sp. UNPF46]|nr:hypothetical protein UNPF46_25240 [Bradyrhizobium sp. UNPF46]